MIVVFDGDIFEEKVLDYDELVAEGEKNNILAVSNPACLLYTSESVWRVITLLLLTARK